MSLYRRGFVAALGADAPADPAVRTDAILRRHGGTREADAVAALYAQPLLPPRTARIALDKARDAADGALAAARGQQAAVDTAADDPDVLSSVHGLDLAVQGWKDALATAESFRTYVQPEYERVSVALQAQEAAGVPSIRDHWYGTTRTDARAETLRLLLVARQIKEMSEEATANVASAAEGATLADLFGAVGNEAGRALGAFTAALAELLAGIGRGLGHALANTLTFGGVLALGAAGGVAYLLARRR